MVTGYGRLEQTVRVWLPVGFFLVVALFPFYWMAITSIKPDSELYNRHLMPLLVHNPTLKHYIDLLTQDAFSAVDLEHDAGSNRVHREFRSSSGSCWLTRSRACASPAPG